MTLRKDDGKVTNMPRGKANESNKAKKSGDIQSNKKGNKPAKKKSVAAAGKSESKTGEKIAAGETKDSGSGAAASKKVSPATARMLKRIAEWERPEKLELLRAWARDGLSMDQIAHNMGFKKRDTLYKYAQLSVGIMDSLRKGKEESDSEVENTLFKKCNGFIQEVLKPMKIRKAEYDPETGKKICDYDEIVYVKDQIYVQPDTVAIKYYLSNRRPDKWKDKIEQVIDTEADTSGVVLLAPVLEKNHEPTEESDMGTTTETD